MVRILAGEVRRLSSITMLLAVLIFTGCLLAVFGIISVHEWGHYLAGLAGGIPRHAMRVRLFVFPQHVALKSGAQWLHPQFDYAQYATAAMAFLRDQPRAVLYVAGGLVLQTVGFAGFVAGGVAAGIPRLWLIPVACAMASVFVLYLIGDLLFTCFTRRPCGDFSFLWKISPVNCLFVTIVTLAVHVTVLLRLF